MALFNGLHASGLRAGLSGNAHHRPNICRKLWPRLPTFSFQSSGAGVVQGNGVHGLETGSTAGCQLDRMLSKMEPLRFGFPSDMAVDLNTCVKGTTDRLPRDYCSLKLLVSHIRVKSRSHSARFLSQPPDEPEHARGKFADLGPWSRFGTLARIPKSSTTKYDNHRQSCRPRQALPTLHSSATSKHGTTRTMSFRRTESFFSSNGQKEKVHW
jgi:hypothetical protein